MNKPKTKRKAPPSAARAVAIQRAYEWGLRAAHGDTKAEIAAFEAASPKGPYVDAARTAFDAGMAHVQGQRGATHTPLAMQDSNRVLELATVESERGFLLLVSAYLEDRLKVLIPNGDAMSFNKCIQAAKRRKALSVVLLNNLNQIRLARNCFAHDWRAATFESDQVRRCLDGLVVEHADRKMPAPHHKKEWLGNLTAFMAGDINEAIARQCYLDLQATSS